MEQPAFDFRPRFSGATYSEPRDGERECGNIEL